MDSERYKHICKHLRIVLEMEPLQRNDYLKSLEADDKLLVEEIERLIQSDKLAGKKSFLATDPQLQPTLFLAEGDRSTLDKNEHFMSQIDGYQIHEQLGKGGMGTIYRAFHLAADRYVALKLLNQGQFNTEEQILRFRKEARAAARMQHESIIPVYDVGEVEGVPYFTMAIIDGRNLDDVLGGHPMNAREAANFLLCLADAISYAHDQGVIHRDLKPSNVMIDHDGKAWLADFGIAKRMDESEGITQTGQIVGTANYIAPEQIDNHQMIGPQTDIYGLGGILYHCLTGQAPFPGNDVIKLFNDVKTRMPVPLVEVNPQVDPDLAAICIRCLQKEPGNRYDSAKALISELNRFCLGEPLRETGSSWKQSFAKVLKYRELSGDLLSAGAARWSLIAAVFLHTSVFLIVWLQLSHYWLWSALTVGTVWQAQINYRFHWSQYWQLQMVERQSGIIQLAVSLGFLCLFLIHGPLTFSQPIDNILEIYPSLMIVLGVATFAHAGIHSGKWLISGFLCFPVSLLIAHYQSFGPPILGAVSALILYQADSELRHVARTMQKTAR